LDQRKHVTETDVIFNNARSWNSYRGPQQGSTFDLRRVALHEFGHVLGLHHPDEIGQSVLAIMNSIIAELDTLADDDIAGAQALYGWRITSSATPPAVNSGAPFQYTITASNSPTAFTAAGLPPGLALNAGTGQISGSCPISGTFHVPVTAHGSSGPPASGSVRITINPLPLQSTSYPPQHPVGSPFSYQIRAANNPTQFTATNLPPGLQLDGDTGLISGVPGTAGSYECVVRARGATSEAGAAVRILISPPEITSGWNSEVELAGNVSYQITATNNPTSFDATGLPPGLQIDRATGLITGSITTPGTYYFTVIARTLYGDAVRNIWLRVHQARITSGPLAAGDIGAPFSFQVRASNGPTSFTCTGLPAGLSINAITGEITGVPELSGNYSVSITVHGTIATVTGTLQIQVVARGIPSETATTILLPVNGAVVADPIRPRIYASTWSGVAVVDSDTLQVVGTIPAALPELTRFSLSPNADRLWITSPHLGAIASLDLNTLDFLPHLASPLRVSALLESFNGRLFVTAEGVAGVLEIDRQTGGTLAHFGPSPVGSLAACDIEISPDRRTLYLVERNMAAVSSYDLSSVGTPALLQRIQMGSNTPGPLLVNPNGRSVTHLAPPWGASLFTTAMVRSAQDLTVVQSTYTFESTAGETAFSNDGSLLFKGGSGSTSLRVFDTASHSLQRTLTVRGSLPPSRFRSLAVDKDNRHLFAAVLGANQGLHIYRVRPGPAAVSPPKTLLNVSTRLKAQPGDDVLIGGFIITGSGPKQVVARAMGPSLPLTGSLADPTLELRRGDGTLLATNDNWNATRDEVIASGLPPGREREAAIVQALEPGSYTAILRGVGNTSGIALVELYDLTPQATARIGNISTRGKVETGDNVMIGGFIIGGDQPTRVIIRAIGPSLVPFGVPTALSDTTLDLHDAKRRALRRERRLAEYASRRNRRVRPSAERPARGGDHSDATAG
jgi:hypothetical protein